MTDKNIEKALDLLKFEIPNIDEYFTQAEVRELIKDLPDKDVKQISSSFMDIEEVWEKPVRRCSWCGKLMTAGFLIGDYYACSEECRNNWYMMHEPGCNDKEAAERQYLIDCYELDEEDVKGMTAQQISDKYHDSEIGDSVFYTEWD